MGLGFGLFSPPAENARRFEIVFGQVGSCVDVVRVEFDRFFKVDPDFAGERELPQNTRTLGTISVRAS
jgi:hypothetical protein